MMILWGIRFFVFKLYESPKYFMGRGRDEQAVEVIHLLAEYNGTTSPLTLEHLQRAGIYAEKEKIWQDTGAAAAVKRQLAKVSGNHVKALFATRKLAYSTSLLIVLWGAFLPIAGLKIADYRSSLHRACLSSVRVGDYRWG
jgi:hypothetical protein